MGPVLKASAKLLARFEDAKIHIDAHAGRWWMVVDGSGWGWCVIVGIWGRIGINFYVLQVSVSILSAWTWAVSGCMTLDPSAALSIVTKWLQKEGVVW